MPDLLAVLMKFDLLSNYRKGESMTTAIHFCTHVLDLEKTMKFYSDALDMVEDPEGTWLEILPKK